MAEVDSVAEFEEDTDKHLQDTDKHGQLHLERIQKPYKTYTSWRSSLEIIKFLQVFI